LLLEKVKGRALTPPGGGSFFLMYLLEICTRGLISDPELTFDMNWPAFDIFDITLLTFFVFYVQT
jgi:hypothetical protein